MRLVSTHLIENWKLLFIYIFQEQFLRQEKNERISIKVNLIIESGVHDPVPIQNGLAILNYLVFIKEKSGREGQKVKYL